MRTRTGESILITGVSSGIGLETAVYLAKRGFRVFGTMRDLARKGRLETEAAREGVQVETLQLDVTDPRSAAAAVNAVVERCGHIGGLVSNAGVQVRGCFEDLSEQEIRRLFETNLFGAMAVTRAVLPHMRQARRGRIVLVSSVAGRMGSWGLTGYCASKFALEGFGESLAQEVAPLGIQVSLVEPGIVKTAFWEANRGIGEGALNPASPYSGWFQEAERMTDWAVGASGTKPSDVARAVYAALAAERPRLRYVVGRPARLLLALRRHLPGEFFERVYFNSLLKRITRPR